MTCPTCKSEYQDAPELCSKCGFPFTASEKERSAFIAQQIIKVGHIDDARKSVKQAKVILFVIGALNILYSLIYTWPQVLYLVALIGISFIMLGVIAERNPIVFLSVGLSILLLIYLADALIDITSIFRGLLWKMIYITGLVFSIVRVKRSNKIMNESTYLNSK